MKPDGGPAFPCIESKVRYYKNWNDRDKEWVPSTSVDKTPVLGMSLRDYFAAKAMQGWLSTYGESRHPAESGYAHIVASNAYAIADAMLKEREK